MLRADDSEVHTSITTDYVVDIKFKKKGQKNKRDKALEVLERSMDVVLSCTFKTSKQLAASAHNKSL